MTYLTYTYLFDMAMAMASSRRTPCIIEGCTRHCNSGRIICGLHLTTKANKLLNIVEMVKRLYNQDITTNSAQAAYEHVMGPRNYELKPHDAQWDRIFDAARDMASWQKA